MEKRFPLAWNYLNKNHDLLAGREKRKFKDTQWYRFGRTQNLGQWEQPKLMIPYMITDLAAYLDRDDNLYFINVTTGGYGITADESRVSLHYLCGLLNSHLLDYYLKRVTTTFHGGYFAANRQFIELLPIHKIDDSRKAETTIRDRIILLVDSMQTLHKQLRVTKSSVEKEIIQRQIDTTNAEINRMVYELYGLTDEEIAIVEG